MRVDRSLVIEQLIAAGRRLDELGLVPSLDGNLSARVSDNTLLVTRTQVRKRELCPPDFVEVDVQGKLVEPHGALPSSELGLHLAVYRRRPDVQCVVHAHPPIAVGFACAGRGLTEPLMPEAVVNLGPVPLAGYATPGTPAMEASIDGLIHDHNALLLANHGAVTVGRSVDQALDRMETLEHTARIALTAQLLGGARPLPPEAVEALQPLIQRPGSGSGS